MIDYSLINNALNFYQGNGFTRIEVPWLVSEYVNDITKPTDKESYVVKHNNKALIASGEQGFLYQHLKDYIPKGRYVTATPCFRTDLFDEFHVKTFMKVELINSIEPTIDELHKMINTAMMFFQSLGLSVITKPIDDMQYDLETETKSGIVELGSYGIRQTSFIKWIYGTGVAEPRTTKILNGWQDTIK